MSSLKNNESWIPRNKNKRERDPSPPPPEEEPSVDFMNDDVEEEDEGFTISPIKKKTVAVAKIIDDEEEESLQDVSFCPPGFQDVTLSTNLWQDFKRSLSKEQKRIVLSCCFKSATTFRSLEITYGAYVKNDFTSHLRGLGILLPESKEQPYFVSLVDNGVIDMDERWEFIRYIFEANNIQRKILFESKESLKPIVSKFPDIKVFNLVDPQIGAWVYLPELKNGYSFTTLLSYFIKEESDTDFTKSPSHFLLKDMILCERLMSHLETALDKESLMAPFLEKEMPLVPILTDMELRGIHFDNSALKQRENELRDLLKEIQEESDKVCGFHVQLSSPKKVADALFNKLKLEPRHKKRLLKSNYFSTTELVLQSIVDDHPLPSFVMKYRQLQKLISNWVESLGDKQYQNKIYTTWSQTGSSTGRLTSSTPNLQNLPKKTYTHDNINVNIRSCFIPAKGKIFVSSDYSQLEMRILAHFSNDENLVDLFKSNEDVHKLVASKWKKKLVKDVTDEERESSKRLAYGIMYGMGPFSLSNHLKVHVSQAHEFLTSFLDTFPGVKQLILDVKEEARKNGSVRTIYHRRRLIDYGDVKYDFEESSDLIDGLEDRSRQDRQAFNSIIQGTAADIVKRAIVNLHQRLSQTSAELVLHVHDELVYQCYEEDLARVVAIVKDGMENSTKLNIPLVVNVRVGKTYGDMVLYSPKDEPTNSTINKEKPIEVEKEEDVESKLKHIDEHLEDIA